MGPVGLSDDAGAEPNMLEVALVGLSEDAGVDPNMLFGASPIGGADEPKREVGAVVLLVGGGAPKSDTG